MAGGAVETERFTRALINTAAAGLRTHCSDAATHSLWLSEDEAEHTQAVRLCGGCPVLIECWAPAVGNETVGVWGGVDRTVRAKAAA